MTERPGAPAGDPAAHYDRIADAWSLLLGDDFHYGDFAGGAASLADATRALTLRMVEAARIEPGVRVLDVGCGTGQAACLLAESHGCRVTGIATSGTVVEQARARAAQRGVADRARFEVRDGMANGEPDASYDRVWVLESSHLMPRKERLLAECARVLVPGGRLALCDLVLAREVPMAEVLKLAKELHTLRLAFGRAKMETLATYRRLAEAAGLAVTEVVDLREATEPTFAHWRRNLDRHRDRVATLIGDEGVAHFAASCDILARFWREGVLGYGLVAARKPGAGEGR